MLKNTNLRLMTAAILAALTLTGSVLAGTYSGGTGEPNDPYLIADINDLLEMRDEPNDWDDYFLLINDIELNGIVFTTAIIAPDMYNNKNLNFFEGTAFSGVFDGNDNKIINLTIDTNGLSNDFLGLFGVIDPNGQVINLGLGDVNILGGDDSCYLGGLCGINVGKISNCYTTGSITGGNLSEGGGLCGINGGTIIDCYATGNVTDGEQSRYLGGLCGSNGFKLYSGNIINYKGEIVNCYATGNVTGGERSQYLGGLCGRNYSKDGSTITNSHATGSVIGGDYSYSLGGLCGYNERSSIITNSYAKGSVTGGDESSGLGGLCGSNSSIISDCYATGSVTGGYYSRFIGGLVGFNGIKARGSGIARTIPTISNCYSTGNVTGGGDIRYPVGGGLVGAMGSFRSTFVTNSFWDVNTSGLDVSDGGIGLTTSQMQTMSSFTDAGWDFVGESINGPNDIWKICEDVDYPRLWWEMINWPIINEEPEVTPGYSNTITWQPVDEAIGYYVICCSDPNLDNIVADSGWIDVNEYTFDGLESGVEYYYAVKARKNCVLESDYSDVVSSLQVTLADAVSIMLDPNSLKNANQKNALTNKIDEALGMIDAGLYEDALAKLENDILKKTDGCANDGEPDKNDWIKSCEQQGEIYPLIIETIGYVESLIEE